MPATKRSRDYGTAKRSEHSTTTTINTKNKIRNLFSRKNFRSNTVNTNSSDGISNNLSTSEVPLVLHDSSFSGSAKSKSSVSVKRVSNIQMLEETSKNNTETTSLKPHSAVIVKRIIKSQDNKTNNQSKIIDPNGSVTSLQNSSIEKPSGITVVKLSRQSAKN